MEMEKVYQIFDKNNNNQYCGFVIAVNEKEANEKVSKSGDFEMDYEIVWKGQQGIPTSPKWGLEETKYSIEDAKIFRNVIK